MTLHWIDHLIFGALLVVIPIFEYFSLRKRAALINSGRTELRMRLYRRLILEEWIAAFVVVALWFLLGRTATGLGLVPQGGAWAWAGYGLTLLICVALVIQMRIATRSAESRAALRKQVGFLRFLTPHTLEERRMFDYVSITAGVCEEIVCRGFVIAYLIALLGVPFWGAALLSSVVFGLGHAYQGPSGVLKSGIAGLVAALLYGMTGSLWAPIIAHAATDFVSGRVSYAAFYDESPQDSSPEVAA